MPIEEQEFKRELQRLSLQDKFNLFYRDFVRALTAMPAEQLKNMLEDIDTLSTVAREVLHKRINE